MPKIFGAQLPPAAIVGLAVVAGIALYMALPQDQATTGTATKRPATTKKAATDQYTKEDYSARFAVSSEPVRNTFRPLVVRASSGDRANAQNPGQVPNAVTGGDGSWVYSGMVTLNGVKEGLLENRKNGDSEYVHVGDHWKNGRIMVIEPGRLQVTGPDGTNYTLIASLDGEQTKTADVPTNGGGNAPVTVPPGLTGPIGQGQAANAGEPQNLGLQPAPNDNRQGRRGRRRWQQTQQGNTP